MRILLAVIWLFGAMAPVASASSQVDAAVKGLRSSNVYIAPGTPKTTSDTATELKQVLREGDNIVLVMVPDKGTSAVSLTRGIDNATGHKYTIGVSVGNEVRGYSTQLPDNVAVDIMSRAESVATTPAEALRTYVQKVHDYQRTHAEQPTPIPGVAAAESGSPILLVALAVTVFALAIAFGGVALLRRSKRLREEAGEITRFRSPTTVREELEKLYVLRKQIQDPDVSQRVEDICRDTERFFDTSQGSSSRDTEQESVEFTEPLSKIRGVIQKYIEAQKGNKERRYVDNPDEVLQLGAGAVDSFAEHVLNSVRTMKAGEMTHFRVDAKMLEAVQYRNTPQ